MQENQYINLLNKISKGGCKKPSSRPGMPTTLSVFGEIMRFDLREEFPVYTTKRVAFKSVKTELDWFLRGDTNIRFLIDRKCGIWNKDAYRWYQIKSKELPTEYQQLSYDEFIHKITIGDINTGSSYNLGDLGSVYGKQWRSWEHAKLTDQGYQTDSIDQVADVLNNLKTNPYGRRHIISAWNVGELSDMALPPCHVLSEFACEPMTESQRLAYYKEIHGKEATDIKDLEGIPDKYISLLMFQRSVDTFLGQPFNVTSYSLMLEIFASALGMVAKDFIWVGGDCHLYDNHLDACETQLSNEIRKMPKISLNQNITIEDIIFNRVDFDAIKLVDYNPHAPIKAEMSAGT